MVNYDNCTKMVRLEIQTVLLWIYSSALLHSVPRKAELCDCNFCCVTSFIVLYRLHIVRLLCAQTLLPGSELQGQAAFTYHFYHKCLERNVAQTV